MWQRIMENGEFYGIIINSSLFLDLGPFLFGYKKTALLRVLSENGSYRAVQGINLKALSALNAVDWR